MAVYACLFSRVSRVQLFETSWTVAHPMDCPFSLVDRKSRGQKTLCPWDFLGKNTGVGCHFLLWGIFLIQGSNLCLLLHLYCRQIP